MIIGLSIGAFTALHVVISLVGIGSGLVVLAGLLKTTIPRSWTAVFLATTVATSLSGFFFPSKAIGPPHIVGALSLVILAVAILALYGRKLAGIWRPVYVACAITALYLNAFVAVVQAFQKLEPLHHLAPQGSEPPFLIAQLATLIAFVVLGLLAVRRASKLVPELANPRTQP